MMRKASALITCTYIAIVLLICPSTAYPLVTAKDGEWTIRFTGYLKNITTYTESINFPVSLLSEFMEDSLPPLGEIEEQDHCDNLTRLRIRMAARRGGTFAWELQYEMHGLATPPDLMLPGFIDTGAATEQWLPIHTTLYDEPGYKIFHILDRAWFRWTPKWGELILGRQAITWTMGRLWYPTDLFGPFLPFDIDQDEKRGVDAVNFAINLGTFSSFRVIYAPLERQEDARVGARLKSTVKGFDIHLMGGYFSGDRVFGGGISHNLFKAVVRAEGAYTHPLEGGDRWSMVVNADRALPHNTYCLIEYYHQSAGASSADDYYKTFPLFSEGTLHGLARDYIGMLVSRQVTALLKPGVLGIVNLQDSSLFLGPNVEWKPIEKVVITAAANLFVSDTSESEFSLFPNTYYASAKIYF